MKLINDYIKLKREIAKAEEDLAVLSDKIKAKGVAVYETEHHTLKVTEVAGRSTVDWQAVVKAAKVPQKIVEDNTKVGSPSLRITVS